MDLDRWIERTLAIQAIPAPTFEERERAVFLEQEFARAGLVERLWDRAGNLLVRIPGGGRRPTIVSAHLDSVFHRTADLSVKRSIRRIRGPGIGDNAVAIAALVEVAYDLAQAELPGDLWLVGNVAEEGLGNLTGMREVVARFAGEVSAYLVLEGMALGHVYCRAIPARRYRLTAAAEGGHSWIHAGRPSALHKLLDLGHQITSLELPQQPKSTLNIGRLDGGRSVNTIADRATLELDLRSESEPVLGELAQSIEKLIEVQGADGVALELSLVGSRPAGGLPEDHPLVQAAVNCLRSAGWRDSVLAAGSTDASVPLQHGYPAVCIGLTTGGEAHSAREFIDLPPLKTGYRALTSLIAASYGLESSR